MREDEMSRNDLKLGIRESELVTMSTYSANADKNCSVITTEASDDVGVDNNEGDSDGNRKGKDSE